jgi:hypothetical protein
VELKRGPFTLRVPLAPREWTSVYGKPATHSPSVTRKFKDLLDTPVGFGLTFGGGNFYGHGIRMAAGSAELEVLSIKVINARP